MSEQQNQQSSLPPQSQQLQQGHKTQQMQNKHRLSTSSCFKTTIADAMGTSSEHDTSINEQLVEPSNHKHANPTKPDIFPKNELKAKKEMDNELGKTLTLFSANANSIKNKMESLRFNISILQPQVVLIQETKLKRKSQISRH